MLLRVGFRDGISIFSGLALGLILGMFLTLAVLGIVPTPSIFRQAYSGGMASRALPQSPYRNEIQAAATSVGIDPNVLHAIVEIESGGDRYAESEAGAQGLAQLMPEIQNAFGVSDPFEPTQNLAGAAQFLSILLSKYDRIDLAIAAYHAGEPLVDRCGCVPRPVDAEYVSRFMKVFDPVVLPYRIKSTHTQGMHGGDLPGRDYAVECGTPLYAPITGEVVAVGHDGYVGPHGSNNSFVKIVGGGIHAGIEIILLHGEYDVAISDDVLQGATKIGREASIGNSSGCHSHFTMKHNGGFVDPAEFIRS